MSTKKKCQAKASASGEQCRRAAAVDGYCKQHHKQLNPVAEPDIEAHPIAPLTKEDAVIYREQNESYDPAFQKFELAKRIARTLAASNLVPDAYKGRDNDCFVAINMGAEIGLEPFQAIQSIAVIEGKPCLYGDGLIGVVRASPICEWISETISEDGQSATCTTQRKGDPKPVTATYTMDDAIRAGINAKFNWKKHPKRMLQMRARAFCLRDAYADLIKGLGVVEEMRDHEDTPPEVTSFDISPPKNDEPAITGTVVPRETTTLAEVERAINQSDSMEDLLKAADMAKDLGDLDQKTARVSYRRHRALLQEDLTHD